MKTEQLIKYINIMFWIYLILAGVFEVAFASFLKLSEGLSKPIWSILFVVCGALSFFLLCKSLKGIPVGTAYLVWTGIGGVGVALIGVFCFNESTSFMRIFFIILILVSILGLKLCK